MKVLMINTPASVNYKGGDSTQLFQTAAELKKLGIEVGTSFELKPDATGYDIAHIFNLRTLDATQVQVEHLKSQGTPIVMSPIYLNPSKALWGTKLIENIFAQKPSEEQLKQNLDGLKNGVLRVATAQGQTFTAEGLNRFSPDYDRRQRQILSNIDYLLPNSVLEMDQLARTLRVGNIPYDIAPYGADPKVFLDADPEPFVKEYGLRDFVLQVGRIERSKNQLLLCHALRNVDLQLVLIGGNLQEYYLQWCKQYGPKNLKIISHLPHEMLKSAYAAARVHVLPSWIETCGLVTMEAALANCSAVVSLFGYEREYYRDLAYYCDPSDVDDIRANVVNAWQNYDRDRNRREELKQLILREYSWKRSAEICLKAYQKVLESKKKSGFSNPVKVDKPKKDIAIPPIVGSTKTKKILFLHPNFPAQFRHIIQKLGRDENYQIAFGTTREDGQIEGVSKVIYKPSREARPETHHYIRNLENAVLQGQSVYRLADKLKSQGFVPDIVYGHSGWGPTLFIKDIFPKAKLLCYFEWFYKSHGSDADFDPSEPLNADDEARIRVKNAPILLDLYSCDRGLSPTNWQKQQFPPEYQSKIAVRHDGIDTEFFKPQPGAKLVLPRINLDLSGVDELVTYVGRGMEPYRGFPQFIETLGLLQKRRPNCHVVIVGQDRVAYGKTLPNGKTYKELMLEKVPLDLNRVHFTGLLPYTEYLQVIQASSVHVYLTRPFVLSWSMLESMSTGCLVLGSDTPPVRELIQDGVNGLLVDFFSPEKICDRIIEVLEHPTRMAELRTSARETITNNYDLNKLLPQHIEWMEQ
jgi:glycosyltransferase involved in cell wall biosynthesis